MIVFTPLDLPKIEPDDWEVFWDIWNTNADYLIKKRRNTIYSDAKVGTNHIWIGLDIFKRPDTYTTYRAPYYSIETRLPRLYNFFNTFEPCILQARLIQSLIPVPAHTDDDVDSWHIRSFFHYTDSKSQWYFTKPQDANGDRTYLNMPVDTNWFAYNDANCWHGTDFNNEHKKILLQLEVRGSTEELVARSINRYSEYVIKFED